MSTSGGSHPKATITNLDDHVVVHVQFNPAALHLTDAARWKPQGNQTRPVLTYEAGEPAKLQLEVQFDGTRGGVDVDEAHVRGLRALLEQRERPSSDGRRVCRPPWLQFAWGSLRFVCVLTSLDVRYLMFRPDGVPVRAKVSLTLTEQDGGLVAGGSPTSALTTSAPTGSSGASEGSARAVTLRPGQTLAALAQQVGRRADELARANHIPDPLEVEPGTTILVPASGEMADAMARAARSEVRSSWSSRGDAGPFDGDASDAPAGTLFGDGGRS